MSRLTPHFRIWLSSGNNAAAFGDGRLRLLEAIGQTTSLASAAMAVGMSYRKAWGDLKKMELGLEVTLVSRQRGGAAKGGMQLTAEAMQLISDYKAFRDACEQSMARTFRRHMSTWHKNSGDRGHRGAG